MSSFLTLAVVSAALTVVGCYLSVGAFRNRNALRGAALGLVSILFLGLAVLCAIFAVATNGYRALTREEVAAVVEVRPTGEHEFEATIRRPDVPAQTFRVRGDQVYVDARVLKWKPYMNLVGLHTSYELDRLGGRYRDVERAKSARRSVHALGNERWVDAFDLVDRFPVFERIVDAEYGSATFVDVEDQRRLEIRVSTSGLLIREAAPDTTPDAFDANETGGP